MASAALTPGRMREMSPLTSKAMSNRRVPPPSNICRLATPLTARTDAVELRVGQRIDGHFHRLARR